MTGINELKGNLRVDKKFEEQILKALKVEYEDLEALAGSYPEDIIDILSTHGVDEERVADALGLRILDKAREIVALAKKDAEAEAKGIVPKKRRAKVPFKERFRLALLSGKKTKTTRPYLIGHPGDEFEAFDQVFEITEVEELTLGYIAKHFYKEEGFKDESEFQVFWSKVHPHRKFNPRENAIIHTFRLKPIHPEGAEAVPSASSQNEAKTPARTTKKAPSVSTSLINQAQKTLDMDWSKMLKNYGTRTCFMPLSCLFENDYNPNTMTEEDEEALRGNMADQGPEHTPPIIVKPDAARNRYEVVDGAHRYRQAKKLKWEQMLVTVRYDVDELGAMSLCWQMNARRGHLDWFKESRMFSTMSKKGKSHKEIADMLHCKVPYVQDRISILVLGEDNVLQAQKKGVSLSALVEVAAIKDPIARQKALDKLLGGEVRTTEEVREITVKKRKCPECGEEAGREKYLKCPKGHYFPMKAPKEKTKGKKKGR